MDRRRFLALVTGSVAAAAGCTTRNSTTSEPLPTETRTATVHAGPSVNGTLTDAPTTSSPTPTVVVTTTESVTITPAATEPTESDASGSNAGGGGGGSGGSGTSAPATPTPTATSDGATSDDPIHLTIYTMTMHRVVGELTCTDGPLAWMAVDIEFLRDGEQLDAAREEMEAPDAGDTLPFDVESVTTDQDSVRVTTAYAYPDENG